MNETVNKFLLAGLKHINEKHLRYPTKSGEPRFTYSSCTAFTKNKERVQKFKETGYSRCIHPNKLDEACSQHNMANGDFKELPKKEKEQLLIKYCILKIIKQLNLLKTQNMTDFKEASCFNRAIHIRD